MRVKNVIKVSKIQSISQKPKQFQNNSGGKLHRGLQYTLVDTYEKI
jgi:hypothetical protein